MKPTFGFDKIAVVPDVISDVEKVTATRVICGKERKPFFSRPSDTLCKIENAQNLIDCGITPVLSDSSFNGKITLEEKLNIAEDMFVELTKEEACDLAEYEMPPQMNKKYLYLDFGIGYHRKFVDMCKDLKERFGGFIEIMGGSLCSPSIYRKLDIKKYGITWVRVGKEGSYGIASLISDMVDESDNTMNVLPYIVADYDVDCVDNISKAFALGSHAVMLSKLLSNTIDINDDYGYSRSIDAYYRGISYTPEEYRLIIEKMTPYRMLDEEVVEVKTDLTVYSLMGALDIKLKYDMMMCGANSLTAYNNKKNIILIDS